MNRNYRVRIGRDDVVLRFYDRAPMACAKEATILRLVSGVARVPALLYAATDAVPTPFAVLEFVEGISFRDLKRRGDQDALANAAYDAGRQLAAINSVLVDPDILGAPDIDPALLAGSNVNARLIEYFLASPVLRARLSGAEVDRINRFAWSRDELLLPYTSSRSLAHGDFNSPNILVRPRDGAWSVAAILDWEFAFAGHAFYDIGNFLRYDRPNAPRVEPSFSRGLLDGDLTLPPEWRTMARLADLGALCELLTRSEVPDNVVAEIRTLVLATLDEGRASVSLSTHRSEQDTA
jgi:aminoglycoside phosphotransferase (APT) family kinase protein